MMKLFVILTFTVITYSRELETYICSGENETYKCELIEDSPPVKNEEPLIFEEISLFDQ